MVQQLNGKEVKEKILKYLLEKGPSLPVHIAKNIGMNSLFTSAFLSEMASDGMIKISDLKVGGSPVYYEPSTTPLLEKYFNSLGGREKEACLLLKEKGILEDSTQTPVIRVVLRSLKDFAFQFKKDDKLFWRYFLFSEEDVRKKIEQETPEIKVDAQEPKQEKVITEKIEKIIAKDEKEEKELERINEQLEEKRKELEKLNQEIESKEKDKKVEKAQKISKKLRPIRKDKPIDETFLNEIRQVLEAKKITLLEIQNFDKKQVIAKIRIENKEKLLIALNKKRVDEEELIKISKSASLQNLEYLILVKGDTPKKTRELIEAYKRLDSIEKI